MLDSNVSGASRVLRTLSNATKCGRGDWYCAICTATTTSIGDCAIGVATAKRTDAAPPPHLLPISYVTSNPNELRESMEILGKEYVGVLRQVDVELAKYQGSSAEEIAGVKCEQAARTVGGVGRAVLVEDTCLAFDALKGLPGEGEPVEVLQGVTRGRIVAPRGCGGGGGGGGGFGWDWCFALIEATEGQTYAEMSVEAEKSISHRCRAVAKLRGLLDHLRSSYRATSS
ncbi:Inosine triphosphate pyrophosphatase [Echinococcus granulosus]|nr:Inosine triphosphate pyrophosphatase [Echinococcus granulosus]